MKIIQDIIGKGTSPQVSSWKVVFRLPKKTEMNFENVLSIFTVAIVHLKPVRKEFHQNVPRKWAGQ